MKQLGNASTVLCSEIHHHACPFCPLVYSMCASTPQSAPRTCEYGLCAQHDCLHATGTDLVHQRAGSTAGNACLQRCLRCWGLQETPGAKAKQGNLASVCGA
jgi:hypothetical protein